MFSLMIVAFGTKSIRNNGLRNEYRYKVKDIHSRNLKLFFQGSFMYQAKLSKRQDRLIAK